MTLERDRAALSIFAVVWAVGALFHLAKWSLWAYTPGSLALTVAATLALASPGALFPLAGLFGAQVWALAEEMPRTSNHLLLSGLVGTLGLLAMARPVLLSRATGALDAGGLYRAFAPPARVTLLLVFFFAGFAKLNADWFRPEASCGGEFYRALAARMPFLPRAAWAEWTTILAALAIELAVPLFLLSRRLRLAGILLAMAFLYAAGIAGFFNLAAITAALLALFAPANMGELLRACSANSLSRGIRSLAGTRSARWALRTGPWIVAGTAIVIALARPWAGRAPEPMLLRTLAGGGRPPVSYAFEAAWWVYGIALVALLLIAVRAGRPEWPSAWDLLAHPAPVLAAIPLLVLLNGMAPYLGLKTETSFAMFSNLRTELSPNHLVVRSPADILGLQRDLVAVESSTDPGLQRIADRGYLLPLTELSAYVRDRTRAGGPDFAVVYTRAGRQTRIERAGSDSFLGSEPPLLVRALVAFRPVAGTGASPCLH